MRSSTHASSAVGLSKVPLCIKDQLECSYLPAEGPGQGRQLLFSGLRVRMVGTASSRLLYSWLQEVQERNTA